MALRSTPDPQTDRDERAVAQDEKGGGKDSVEVKPDGSEENRNGEDAGDPLSA